MSTVDKNKDLTGNDIKLPIRSRLDINREIAEKWELISEIKTDIRNLKREELLLCDDKQWFTEEYQDVIISRRPMKKENCLLGKIHWIEEFKDDHTGESIFVNRSELVRVNGVWQ